MSQNTATSDTAWHDDIASPTTEADYRELQAQFDQLQTELFNYRKKSASQAVQIETLAKEVDSANDRAGAIADERDALAAQVEALMKVVEGNALVHISANTAEISVQAVKQFVSFIPEFPYGINKSIQEFANQYVELIRQGGAE